MEKATNQKVIALRFDTVSEPEYLLSIIEAHLKLTADQGRPLEADELIKALNGCIELFKKPKLRTVDDAGVDIETGKTDATAYQRAPVDPKKEYMEKIHGKDANK